MRTITIRPKSLNKTITITPKPINTNPVNPNTDYLANAMIKKISKINKINKI